MSEINMKTGLFDFTITTEHAGPDWVASGKRADWNAVQTAIESARWLAPVGSTVTVKIVPAASAE